MPFLVGARLDEELHLHLLEFAGAEDEVARRDLVPERLADLADAERDLLPRGLLDVLVVDEDALRRLWAQVRQTGLILGRAEVGTEQTVEHPLLGERPPGSAVRAGQVGQAAGGLLAVVLFLVGLDQVIRPEPLLAQLPLPTPPSQP